MSDFNSQSGWYQPNEWRTEYDWSTATVPQDESTSLEQQDFGTVHPVWFDPSRGAFAPPAHLGSVPPSVPSGIGPMPGPVSQVSLGRVPNDNRGSLPTMYGGSGAMLGGRSMTAGIQAMPGIQAMQVPVGRVMHNTERHDGQANLSPKRYIISQPNIPFPCF